MTCIAYDGRFVAADKMATAGSRQGTCLKLHRHGRKVLAFCGDYAHGIAMVQWFVEGCDPKAVPHSSDDNWAALYVFEKDKAILCFERRTHPVVLFDEIMGAGSGGLCALGAMSAGKNARTAVEIATRWCDGVGNGVDVFDLWELADDHDRADGPGAAAPTAGADAVGRGGVDLLARPGA